MRAICEAQMSGNGSCLVQAIIGFFLFSLTVIALMQGLMENPEASTFSILVIGAGIWLWYGKKGR